MAEVALPGHPGRARERGSRRCWGRGAGRARTRETAAREKGPENFVCSGTLIPVPRFPEGITVPAPRLVSLTSGPALSAVPGSRGGDWWRQRRGSPTAPRRL